MSFTDQTIPSRAYTQTFFYSGTGDGWTTYTVPPGCSTVVVIAYGAGGGGGGGMTRAASLAKSGGGGGGSGSVCSAIYPAFRLPSVLYIKVGAGGSGGTATNGGSTGGSSYVADRSSVGTPNANTLICLGVGGGGGGGGGTSSGTAGSAGAATTTTTATYLNSCIGFNAQTLGDGIAGNTTSVNNLTITGWATTGGTCGGGADASNITRAGGSILSPSSSSRLPADVVGGDPHSTGGGDPGFQGYTDSTALIGLGGTGGGACAITGTGGAGGIGGLGSGGGGGGAGVTGGTGGAGGNGCVRIVAF